MGDWYHPPPPLILPRGGGGVKFPCNRDSVKDTKSQNQQQEGVYFYYLYNYTKENPIGKSICSIRSPVYANSTYSTSFNLTKKTSQEEEYENIVVAYIIREGEDYLFSFNTVNVTITPENDRLFWYLIIFGVVMLIIIAGTLMLYQEIRKKERELTIGSVREKMKDF